MTTKIYRPHRRRVVHHTRTKHQTSRGGALHKLAQQVPPRRPHSSFSNAGALYKEFTRMNVAHHRVSANPVSKRKKYLSF